MNRVELEKFILETYNASADSPWEKYPENRVFRHVNNKKWFALIMNISKEKLGLNSNEMLDIMNLKCDSILMGSCLSKPGFFPAYHMNKNSWISVALDNTVSDDTIKLLLDISFDLTSQKGKPT